MKPIKSASIVLLILMIAACTAHKKTVSSKSSTEPATNTSATTTNSATTAFSTTPTPSSGIFSPRNEELIAIQAKYKEETMKTLTEGYTLYTGVCTNCHPAKSIYKRQEAEWPGILDNMALKAKISDTQKDAVYKYVLAIKATQPR